MQERGFHVDSDYAVPIPLAEVDDGCTANDAGIVEEDVNPAETARIVSLRICLQSAAR